MIWKSLLVAFLAVGTTASFLAQLSLLNPLHMTDEQMRFMTIFMVHTCIVNGHEDKIDDAVSGMLQYYDCLETLPDQKTIVTEFDDARSNNTLSDFFKKYCAMAPQLKMCLQSFLHVTPCMDPDTRQNYDFSINKTDVIIDFMCYKDGERPILFFAEGGQECFVKKHTEIVECGQIRPSLDTPICTAITDALTCVVNEMEDCSSHVPSELTNLLFKAMWQPELCNESDWVNPYNK